MSCLSSGGSTCPFTNGVQCFETTHHNYKLACENACAIVQTLTLSLRIFLVPSRIVAY